MGNHALVFGATGVQGWAIVNEILNNYPSSEAFDRVTALSNRPFTENLLWPDSDRLLKVSGLDLLASGGQNGIERFLEWKIEDVETVTHVFYCAYIFNPDPKEESSINLKLLQRAILSIQHLSPKLKFVLLPTGTKAYGVHLVSAFPFRDNLPLSEDLPRTPEPDRSQNFYYHLCDWLAQECQGKAWTWCEIRPDIVVGFMPNNNFYGISQVFATFLALFKEVHGEGAECPFPGTETVWENQVNNDSSQDIIARFATHCSLHSETCGQGQAFNIADNSEPATWKTKWPTLCEYFGLKGTPPPNGGGPDLASFFRDHSAQSQKMENRYGLVSGRVGNDRTLVEISQMLLQYLNFDRRLDMTKCHKAWNAGGQAQQVTSQTAWWTAFDRFRAAKIIP